MSTRQNSSKNLCRIQEWVRVKKVAGFRSRLQNEDYDQKSDEVELGCSGQTKKTMFIVLRFL